MKNLCLTFLLVLAAGLAHAQWTRTALRLAPNQAPRFLDVPVTGVVWVVVQDVLVNGTDAVALSTTGGQTWTTHPIPGLTADDFVTSMSALDATTAWVSVATIAFDPKTNTTTQGGRVLRTANGGQSWQTQTAPGQLDGTLPFGVQFFSANVGVVLGQSANGFEGLRTTDSGLTWTALPALPTPDLYEVLLQTPPARVGNHLWVGTDQGRVLLSPDAGLTWQVSTAVSNGTEAHQVAFRDPLNGLVSSTGPGKASYLFATADGGLTWSPPRPQPGAPGPVALAPVPNARQVLLLAQPGSAVTADNGLTQTVLEAQLLHLAGRMVSTTEGYTAVVDTLTGAGTGIYRLAPQGLPTRPASAPAALAAYPNPSPDGQFHLPAPSGFAGATWRVLDALGREVLAPQLLPATAADALLDLSRYRPGLYTLEVRSAAGVARQQLVRP